VCRILLMSRWLRIAGLLWLSLVLAQWSLSSNKKQPAPVVRARPNSSSCPVEPNLCSGDARSRAAGSARAGADSVGVHAGKVERRAELRSEDVVQWRIISPRTQTASLKTLSFHVYYRWLRCLPPQSCTPLGAGGSRRHGERMCRTLCI
jgi:hypothetical protein